MPEHRLMVEPAGVEIVVAPGQSVLDAAESAGVRWPTVCHGGGICLTCHFIIGSHEENFSSQPESEQCAKALATIRKRYSDVPPNHVRLACQTTLTGDAVAICRKARAAP